MKIKSFGCSFIFGTDLSDNPDSIINTRPVGQFSRLTWPALLANKLSYDYECFARPGSGNLQIAERVLNECATDSNSFFVIDWTWIDRFDYFKSDHVWQSWGTVRPNSNESAAEIYYKHLHAEYSDKLRTLIYIKTVVDLLKEKNIKFIMTYEDDLLFDQTWNTSDAVNNLQKSLSSHVTTFEGTGFYYWSKKHEFPMSATWHPLELAHVSAAEYMFDYVKG
jgi:hypothetical protein